MDHCESESRSAVSNSLRILEARITEWVAFPFSMGSSQPRDQTQVSCITGRFFTSWTTREAQEYWSGYLSFSSDLPDPEIKPGSPAFQADLQSVTSVTQLCPTLCNLVDCCTPGLPVHHQLLEFTQTHLHWVGDAIQPSHPLSSPSPPASNHSQY